MPMSPRRARPGVAFGGAGSIDLAGFQEPVLTFVATREGPS